jgi:hypothetical protein
VGVREQIRLNTTDLVGMGDPSVGARRSQPAADYSPPSSAECKNLWNFFVLRSTLHDVVLGHRGSFLQLAFSRKPDSVVQY